MFLFQDRVYHVAVFDRLALFSVLPDKDIGIATALHAVSE